MFRSNPEHNDLVTGQCGEADDKSCAEEKAKTLLLTIVFARRLFPLPKLPSDKLHYAAGGSKLRGEEELLCAVQFSPLACVGKYTLKLRFCCVYIESARQISGLPHFLNEFLIGALCPLSLSIVFRFSNPPLA